MNGPKTRKYPRISCRSSILHGPTWFEFGILAIFGLLLLGGLAFTIAMLSIPKTRTLGIVLLVVGSIIILPIVAGFSWLERDDSRARHGSNYRKPICLDHTNHPAAGL